MSQLKIDIQGDFKLRAKLVRRYLWCLWSEQFI